MENWIVAAYTWVYEFVAAFGFMNALALLIGWAFIVAYILMFVWNFFDIKPGRSYSIEVFHFAIAAWNLDRLNRAVKAYIDMHAIAKFNFRSWVIFIRFPARLRRKIRRAK